MKKLVFPVLFLLFAAGFSSTVHALGAARGIGSQRSPHNFSHESWLPVTRICGVCHVPHSRRRAKKRLKKKYKDGLRWNSSVNEITYSLYNSSWSSSLTGIRDSAWTSPVTGRPGGLPDGLSKLCLSCHNGVVAPDVFNLHHFVSLEYDITKTELRDPEVKKIGVSGPISEILDNGKIQCSSCHDAHDEETIADTKLLRVEKERICMVCHIK